MQLFEPLMEWSLDTNVRFLQKTRNATTPALEVDSRKYLGQEINLLAQQSESKQKQIVFANFVFLHYFVH